MAIPQTEIDRIVARANIVDIVSDYVRLQKRGGRFWGLSPFKSEKTASFCVDEEKGLYYCFSTHQGGNTFRFLMDIEHLTFPEAVDMIAKRYGIRYNRGKGDDSGAENTVRNTLLELYARVSKSFHHLLTHNQEAESARRYLHSRGITKSTVDEFMLGYCPQSREWLWNFLTKNGYTDTTLQMSGLFRAQQQTYALFAGRIIFPITNRKDEIVGFGGRAHTSAHPKYINSPETPLFKKRNEFFGKLRSLIRASEEKSVYIVEGYMDVLALHQLGVSNVVATLGTAFSAEQGRILKRIAQNAILLFDEDEAGNAAVMRSVGILQEIGIDPRICKMNTGLDPAEMMQKNEDFKKNCLNYLVTHTKSVIEYLLESGFSKKHIRNDSKSEVLLRKIFGYISRVSTMVRRELYVKQVADYLNVDRDSMLRDFRDYVSAERQPIYAASTPGERASHTHTPTNVFELECMMTSICCAEEFEYLRAIVDAEHFENSAAKYLFELQERAFQNNTSSSKEIIEMIGHAKLKEYAIQKAVQIQVSDCKRAITHIAHRLKKRYLMRSRTQQITLLRAMEREIHPSNQREIEDVQLEIMYINKEILKQ